MSERMRVIWAIGLIAAVGCGAFFGLRALAAGGQQTTMESGLSIPAQSDGAGPQSAPVVAATEEPTPTPEPAPEPTSEDPASAPTPAPVATNPYYVAPTSPQRAVPDDDDDDDDDDHDDDTDD